MIWFNINTIKTKTTIPIRNQYFKISYHQNQFDTKPLNSQNTNTNSVPRPTYMAKPPQFQDETGNFGTGRAMYDFYSGKFSKLIGKLVITHWKENGVKLELESSTCGIDKCHKSLQWEEK